VELLLACRNLDLEVVGSGWQRARRELGEGARGIDGLIEVQHDFVVARLLGI
jgi:hypothetical protein